MATKNEYVSPPLKGGAPKSTTFLSFYQKDFKISGWPIFLTYSKSQ